MTAKEHNEFYYFFHDITGEAMMVHREFHEGLVESAYEAALEYLLKNKGYPLAGLSERILDPADGLVINLVDVL